MFGLEGIVAWEVGLLVLHGISWKFGATLPLLPFVGDSLPMMLVVQVIVQATFFVWILQETNTKPVARLQAIQYLIGYIPFLLVTIGLRALEGETFDFPIAYVVAVQGIYFVLWSAYIFSVQVVLKPGLFPWPIVGQFPEALQNFDRVRDWETEYLQTLAPTVYTKFGNNMVLWTMDEGDIRHVLERIDIYEQGYTRKVIFEDLLGEGIFNVDGDKWLAQRKKASKQFSVKRFRDFMVEVFSRGSEKVLLKISEASCKESKPFDMQDLFFRFTLDSFSIIAFDLDVGCLDSEKQPPFAQSFDIATLNTAVRFFSPLWSLKKMFNVGTERALRDSIAVLDKYIYQVIKDRKGLSREELAEKQDFMTQFMSLRDKNGNPPDDKYLRDLVVNFLLAGRDTTASALSWTVLHLSKNPHCVTKMREEMNRVLQKTDRDRVTPDFYQLKDLQYVHAVFIEAMRLSPPVPVDGKVARIDDTLPSGLTVRAGDTVTYAPYACGRNPKVYDSPEEFRPERWLDKEGKFQRPNPYTYPVFQGGPRRCLGEDMAIMEGKLMLAVLYQQYDIELAMEKEPTYLPSLTMAIKGPLMVRAREYSPSS
mmetsp:Transcript_17138/g.48272  ORF Transcript_17138/g.48272 Transcript_17138/m.48272 type:complete len:593 (+) Transcript_17138:352-2130(+)